MGDSVTGDKKKDKSLSEGIAAGFGDQTDAQKNQEPTDSGGPSMAAQMLSGMQNAAADAAEMLGLKKKGVDPYKNLANKATGQPYQ